MAVKFEDLRSRTVTEISCHGLGSYFLGDGIKTIIDIGGQDSKIIKIDPDNGKVTDFVMNDKCAAGTGRFLEKAANLLELDVKEIGAVSLSSEHPSSISSQCVVFSESEIISGRAKGDSVSDIAAGIHRSVAKRVQNLLKRAGIEGNVLFTGGVSNNVGMRKALEEVLGFPIQQARLDTVYAGALGAAVFAAKSAFEAQQRTQETERFRLDLTQLEDAVERAKEALMRRGTGKKQVGYLCAYTPQEILAAADVSPLRLFHAGGSKEVSAGELITQSVFCDFTKSTLGAFAEKNPLYENLDKVYTFYTCDCIRSTTEAINDRFVPATIFNLPRVKNGAHAREYYTQELGAFVKDLESLTGKKVEQNQIRINIAKYNEAKRLLRKISDYRKADHPLLGNTEYQKIANSYYYLPVDELTGQLRAVDRQLEEAPDLQNGVRPVRLMIAGGMLAEGDTKVVRMIEEDLGAKIVVEDNCSGVSPFSKDIHERHEDVFADLAEGYLDKAPCARMRPLKDRLEHTMQLARDYRVDGVIYYYLKFCPCYGMTKNEFLKSYEEMGIPVLEMPVDYSVGDEGQIKTRLEAFIEVLASERNVRHGE